jgi:hypothetical protein
VPANEILPGGRFSSINYRRDAVAAQDVAHSLPIRSDRCAGGQASCGTSSRQNFGGGRLETPAGNGIGFGERVRFALQPLFVPNASQFPPARAPPPSESRKSGCNCASKRWVPGRQALVRDREIPSEQPGKCGHEPRPFLLRSSSISTIKAGFPAHSRILTFGLLSSITLIQPSP